ncbi:MAG: aldo/keto reductase [Planctomycetes bacterium]|nr:aldo/keto reductase [Planctomycetota bacterium]
MEYIDLPNCGIRLSAVIMGCWQFGGGATWGEAPSARETNGIVAACLEEGINTFDTAEVYGSGTSEEMLGEALKASGAEREDYVVATKLWGKDFSGRNMREHLEGSLQRLGLEYVEIYQIHWPPETFGKAEAGQLAEAARELVQSGKVKAMAVSNFKMKELQLFDDISWIASNQVPYSLLWRYYDISGAVEHGAASGVAHLAYSPLAQGLLTGRFGADYTPPEGHTRSGNRLWRAPIYQQALKVVEVLKSAAAEAGRTPAQTAINWITGRPGNFAAIVGARDVEYVKQNAGAVGWKLDAQTASRLDEASMEFQRAALDPDEDKMWG